jgi:hypothetical protein
MYKVWRNRYVLLPNMQRIFVGLFNKVTYGRPYITLLKFHANCFQSLYINQ